MQSEPLSGRARAVLAAGTAILVALTMYAYHPAIRLWPWGLDAVRWSTRADPAVSPDWATWVFFSRHFIGWRPVTAFTFTLNAWLGDSPVAMHLVDFIALGATLALVGVVAAEMYRSDRPAGGPRADRAVVVSALLAVALVALHPVIQEIVPYTARRSYDLASAFGLGGLALWLRELRQPLDRWWSGWIAGATALLFLSFGSNEASFPIAVLLPVLALHRRWPADRAALLSALRPAVAPMVPAALLALGRNLVLADDFSTGYVRKWFAYAEGGRNRLRLLEAFEPGEVLSAAWTYVLFPSSGTGDESLLWRSGPAFAGAVLVLAWVGWGAVARPLAESADPVARRPLALFLWAFGTAALYAVANTWFWREGYPLLLPFALTAGAVLHAALAVPAVTGRERAVRAAHVAAVTLLLVSVGWYSPVLRGWDMNPVGEEVAATRFMEAIQTTIPELPEHAQIWLVVPGDATFATEVTRAAQRLPRPGTLRFRPLATVPRHEAARQQHFVARVDPEGPTLVLNPGAVWEPAVRGMLRVGTRREVPLAALARQGDRRVQIWWWEGPGFRKLRRFTSQGVELGLDEAP